MWHLYPCVEVLEKVVESSFLGVLFPCPMSFHCLPNKAIHFLFFNLKPQAHSSTSSASFSSPYLTPQWTIDWNILYWADRLWFAIAITLIVPAMVGGLISMVPPSPHDFEPSKSPTISLFRDFLKKKYIQA